MKHILTFCTVIILLSAGCTKDFTDVPVPNKPPKTYLWLFPDSTLAEGISKQRIHWWGVDPDGIVKGYLFASGKLLDSGGHVSDTVGWRWRVETDTLIAFPLLVRRDTFQVAVRAVDNTFPTSLVQRVVNDTLRVDGAMVRLGGTPYLDANENGLFDSGDVALPSLRGAVDPVGAVLGMPILNQPPSVEFAQNPNDPSVTMQQPETTYTAATFSWIGTDPDGDQTIRQYEVALNDSTDPSRWFIVPGSVRLISLVVPRTRSDGVVGEVDADVYTGTFQTGTRLIGTLSHLKLDSPNTFYIRARDVAGDVSSIIQMPARNATRKWFVKSPRTKLLLVNDFISNVSGNRDSVLAFYRRTFSSVGGEFATFDVLDIGRFSGATTTWPQQKRDGRFGVFVPPFIDPAFLFTLHLYDVVYWYTDIWPSLGVAQYPLFEYPRDPDHRGKIIFSTMFFSSADPRGALKDFAPIDSVSSVDLETARRPILGEKSIPVGYLLVPDSTDQSSIYPVMKIKQENSPAISVSVYMRPVYRRTDARYIYHIQDDSGNLPPRYVYLATLGELRSVSAVDSSSVWACGLGGIVFHTSNGGESWSPQTSGTNNALNSIYFLDRNNGWAVGDAGTILQTGDGGATWNDRTLFQLQFENLQAVAFTSQTEGIAVGTDGVVLRSTNGGINWFAPNIHIRKHVRAVRFFDQGLGLAVGDSGLVIRTTDSGANWDVVPPITLRNLSSVSFADGATAWAVGASATNIKSVDGGSTWQVQSSFAGSTDLRSVYFTDISIGWSCGLNGLIYKTINGGLSWALPPNAGSGVNWNLNSLQFVDAMRGWCVGANGMMLHTETGGDDPLAQLNWVTQPRGHLELGVIDGVGIDGHRSFAFIGFPIHLLNGDGDNVKSLFDYILHNEFGE